MNNPKSLKHLPVSVYMELHNILFLFSILSQSINLFGYDFIEDIYPRSIWEQSRRKRILKRTTLKKWNDFFRNRSIRLFNLFSNHMVSMNHNYVWLKLLLTDNLWKPLTHFYNSKVPNTRRFLCLCASWKSEWKLSKLLKNCGILNFKPQALNSLLLSLL